MKLCGLIPNFYIHVSGSDLYISMIGLTWNLLWENESTEQTQPAEKQNNRLIFFLWMEQCSTAYKHCSNRKSIINQLRDQPLEVEQYSIQWHKIQQIKNQIEVQNAPAPSADGTVQPLVTNLEVKLHQMEQYSI